jgi:hypothetical protein
MMIVSIAGLALHFLPSVLGIFQKQPTNTSAPNSAGPATPNLPLTTGRPIMDLIHYILVQQKNPTAQNLDTELQILRQVLDNLGVPSIQQIPALTLPPKTA